VTSRSNRDTAAVALVARILAAIERFHISECEGSIDEAFQELEPVQLVREVLGPALRAAGERWHRGEITVVQEHLLSGAVRRHLFRALDQYNRTASGPTLVFTTLSGERHEMGTLMCAFVAASLGYRCVHLGPDLPVTEIAHFCRNVTVAGVVLSIVTHAAVIDAPEQLSTLRKHLPASVELWIGGGAAEQMAAGHIPPDTVVMRDLNDFISRLPSLERRDSTS
jgi:MerR family transcriptional regulator, light-induced transcriptional regulator